jgi:hypothetical protein
MVKIGARYLSGCMREIIFDREESVYSHVVMLIGSRPDGKPCRGDMKNGCSMDSDF